MNKFSALKHSGCGLAVAALLWLGWLMPAGSLAAAAAPKPAKISTPAPAIFHLVGTLLGVDGRPAAGVTVYLVGVDRMNLVDLAAAAERPHYHAKTDARGRFLFDFKPVPDGSGGHYESPADGLPWFGDYYVIVPAAADHSHAGAVSPRINNEWLSYAPKYNKKKIPNHIKLQNEETRLTLRLAKGVTLAGRVLDHDGHPMTSRTVSILLDLHAGTHTGYGGEIFERTAKTDEDGRFQFDQLYPAVQSLTLKTTDAPLDLYWTRTRLGKNGAWVEEQLDEINLADAAQRQVEIMASDKEIYEYRGTVRDEQGNPIAGATVRGGISYHREQKSYEDTHSSRSAKTDAQGRYRLMSPTPWVYGLGPSKDGYKEAATPQDDRLTPPGTHDFVLNRLPPLPLNGVLLDADGRPAVGVELDLISADQPFAIDLAEAGRRPHYHVQTGADGRFSFMFLPPEGGGETRPGDYPGTGDYYIAAAPAADGRHAGVISPLIHNDRNPAFSQAYNRAVSAYVAPGDNKAAPLTLRLARGGEVEGRVVDDVTSRPLAGQTVALQPDIFYNQQIAQLPALLRRTTTTDAQGRFHFANVAPTSHTLTVEPARFWIRTRLGADGPWLDNRVDRLNFGVAKARFVEIATSSRPHFELRGVVRDKTTGKPIAGATVDARAAWRRQGIKSYSDDSFHQEAQTGADGRYRIMMESPWIVSLYTWKHGYQAMNHQVTAIAAPGAYDLELAPEGAKAK